MGIFANWWQKVINCFEKFKEYDMQKGELIVSGKNSFTIPLDGFPSQVNAHFSDPCVIVPCNSQDVDFLQYDVHTSTTHQKGFVLVISWSVSGTREIKWKAEY